MEAASADDQDRSQRRTAVVLGATADIGREIASRLLQDEWFVVGMGRTKERLGALAEHSQFIFIDCDLTDVENISIALKKLQETTLKWDLFVSSAGTMEPIGPFFSLDFDRWEQSVIVNTTAQLRILHGIWSHRRLGCPVDVMLMAGGGTNNPLPNYSAYCISKIALIKMCELIDDEEQGVNAFIIGPGFVRTRIHQETFRAGEAAGSGYPKTLKFFETSGTSFDDIYRHMRWCMSAGRMVAGGRNFSTVHDPWREGGKDLAKALESDPNAYKLRRQKPGNVK
ncbi:SDR family NAD(P)-dependent oxidoreductase [Labrys neptuniae]